MSEPKWKDTFYYTQRERKGIFILLLVFILLLAIQPFIRKLNQPSQADFSAFKKAIKAFEATKQTAPIQKDTLFAFNPNTVSRKNLLRLGLAPKIAQRIVNYRKKGGQFYKKEDLQKIYGLQAKDYQRLAAFITIPAPKRAVAPLKKRTTRKRLRPHPFNPNKVSKEVLLSMGVAPKTVQQWMRYRAKGGVFKQTSDLSKLYALKPEDYKQLAPYIQIPANPSQKATTKNNRKELRKPTTYTIANEIKIDVNTASMQAWQQLHGIGPHYAKKIISFRKKLGGFVSINQIRTTQGLPDSVFQKIKPSLILSSKPTLLAINKASVAELAAHPYLQKKQAKVIVNYRKNHGAFKNWEELRKVKVLSETELERIRPYLKF